MVISYELNLMGGTILGCNELVKIHNNVHLFTALMTLARWYFCCHSIFFNVLVLIFVLLISVLFVTFMCISIYKVKLNKWSPFGK